jgi:general secretion pathway protein B
MSYILDALRRADAERSRGAVPGLHAQGLPADGEPAARNYGPLIWFAGAAGVLVVAGVVIVLFGPWRAAPAPEATAVLAPAPELAPTARDNVPATPAQGEQPAPQPGAIDPGARPIEPPMGRTPPPYPPAAAPRPAVAPTRVATLEPRADARRAPPAPAPAPVPVEHYGAPMPAAATPVPAPASAAARGNAVANINDLPPNVRSTLPRLAVGGAIYSETPSARMVILNGQVFHEGDKPAADTVLEQIRLKSAVFNFRGQRYEVSF